MDLLANVLTDFVVTNFSIIQPFLEEHSHSDEEDDDHDDDQQAGPDDHPGDGPLNIDIEQIIPIVDSILEQDDKVEKQIENNIILVTSNYE